MEEVKVVEELKEGLKNKPQEGEVLTIKNPVTCGKDEHEFVLTRTDMGPAAECVRCRVGYQISPGTEVKNGHIYIHGELVI